MSKDLWNQGHQTVCYWYIPTEPINSQVSTLFAWMTWVFFSSFCPSQQYFTLSSFLTFKSKFLPIQREFFPATAACLRVRLWVSVTKCSVNKVWQNWVPLNGFDMRAQKHLETQMQSRWPTMAPPYIQVPTDRSCVSCDASLVSVLTITLISESKRTVWRLFLQLPWNKCVSAYMMNSS